MSTKLLEKVIKLTSSHFQFLIRKRRRILCVTVKIKMQTNIIHECQHLNKNQRLKIIHQLISIPDLQPVFKELTNNSPQNVIKIQFFLIQKERKKTIT